MVQDAQEENESRLIFLTSKVIDLLVEIFHLFSVHCEQVEVVEVEAELGASLVVYEKLSNLRILLEQIPQVISFQNTVILFLQAIYL